MNMTKQELNEKIQELKTLLNSKGFNFQNRVIQEEDQSVISENEIIDGNVSLHVYTVKNSLNIRIGAYYKALNNMELEIYQNSLPTYLKMTNDNNELINKIECNFTNLNPANITRLIKQINNFKTFINDITKISKELIQERQERLDQINDVINKIETNLNIKGSYNNFNHSLLNRFYSDNIKIDFYDLGLSVEINVNKGFSLKTNYSFKSDYEQINQISRVLNLLKGL